MENSDNTEAQSNNIDSIKQACPCQLPNCPSACLAPDTLTSTSTKQASKTIIKGTGIPSINIKPSEEVLEVDSLNIKQGCEYLYRSSERGCINQLYIRIILRLLNISFMLLF